jgi:serine/threonine protein kinase
MVGATISHCRITDKLGEGGMGFVYKAEDTSLDRPVALKFLAAHLVSDEEARKRFEREAKAAAALNHPNVCTVYEIAEDNARTFIAMAFLEGEGLDKKIEAGPLKRQRRSRHRHPDRAGAASGPRQRHRPSGQFSTNSRNL